MKAKVLALAAILLTTTACGFSTSPMGTVIGPANYLETYNRGLVIQADILKQTPTR